MGSSCHIENDLIKMGLFLKRVLCRYASCLELSAAAGQYSSITCEHKVVLYICKSNKEFSINKIK